MEVLRMVPDEAEAEVGGGLARRSRCSVRRRASGWRVHQWDVRAGGSVVCRAAALRTGGGGLLLWVGGEGQPQMGAVALGLPCQRAGGGALCSLLAVAGGAGGGDECGAALARRLAVALRRPVHVCCGCTFDRFTAPLVERGLIAEIKSRPECFQAD